MLLVGGHVKRLFTFQLVERDPYILARMYHFLASL